MDLLNIPTAQFMIWFLRYHNRGGIFFIKEILDSIEYNDFFEDAGWCFGFENVMRVEVAQKEGQEHKYHSLPADLGLYFDNTLLKIMDIEKFKKEVNDYILLFEQDKLVSSENRFSYQKHLELVEDLFGKQYEQFGRNISIPSVINDLTGKYKQYRVIECLLSLERKGYVKINEVYIHKKSWDIGDLDGINKIGEHITKATINVSFLRSPAEISDIYKYWISYGDLRANERDAVAFYKDNKYPFQAAKGNAFKVLCYLVKNHGQHIKMEDLAKQIDLCITDKKIIKARIKDYIKEIKNHLKISQDTNKTLDIMVVEDSVILIANPTKSKSNK
jgi:hypothetical protein